MGTGVRGLNNNRGCWLAQVIVDGTRHRKSFGRATPENAVLAVQWMDALRATRTAVLVGGTADSGTSCTLDNLALPPRSGVYVPPLPKRPAVQGLYAVAGAWWAKVSVQGTVYTQSFGACTYSNAEAAVRWLMQHRASSAHKGTRALDVPLEEAMRRVQQWLGLHEAKGVSLAERYAANRKAYAKKKRK